MFGYDAVRSMSKKPSEYFVSNCYMGSFFTNADVDTRGMLGADHLMWGADYPHHEGTSPHSVKALRVNFAGLPDGEVRQMVAGTAAALYGFDLDFLQTVADRIGPTYAEINTPLEADEYPRYPDETVCWTFNPDAIPSKPEPTDALESSAAV
jgi:hypothetical protein